MVAGRLANLALGANQHVKGGSIDLPSPAISQPAAAELLNVSVPSVKRARVVQEQGTPELVEAVDAGISRFGVTHLAGFVDVLAG